jgi:hypothetical protein
MKRPSSDALVGHSHDNAPRQAVIRSPDPLVPYAVSASAYCVFEGGRPRSSPRRFCQPKRGHHFSCVPSSGKSSLGRFSLRHMLKQMRDKSGELRQGTPVVSIHYGRGTVKRRRPRRAPRDPRMPVLPQQPARGRLVPRMAYRPRSWVVVAVAGLFHHSRCPQTRRSKLLAKTAIHAAFASNRVCATAQSPIHLHPTYNWQPIIF